MISKFRAAGDRRPALSEGRDAVAAALNALAPAYGYGPSGCHVGRTHRKAVGLSDRSVAARG